MKVNGNFAHKKKTDSWVFTASSRMISDRKNRILQNNLLCILLFILALICGIVLCGYASDGESMLNYVGRLLIIFSATMIIMMAVSTPQTIAQLNRKISQIYIEITNERVKGMTMDEDERCVYFDVSYEEIDRIVYSPMIIAIYLKNGKSFQFNVFCNPREVYNAIMAKGEGCRKESL